MEPERQRLVSLLELGLVGQLVGVEDHLGYPNDLVIGDDETPASVGDIDLGGPASQIAAGGNHTWATARCSSGTLATTAERERTDELPASVEAHLAACGSTVGCLLW